MTVPTKADPITKERSCKRGTVSAKGVDGINMILALLEVALGGLRVWEDWLQPASLGTGVSCSEESLSSSGSSYSAEWSGFLRSKVPTLRSLETFQLSLSKRAG